jgi:hypothetical protein
LQQLSWPEKSFSSHGPGSARYIKSAPLIA